MSSRWLLSLAVTCLILAACESSAIPTPTPAPATPQAVAEATIKWFGCEWILDKYTYEDWPHWKGVRNVRNWVKARGGSDVAPFIFDEDMERAIEICTGDA